MYILNEQTMNGPVCVGINSIGIDAESFDDAIKKIKLLPNFNRAINITETSERFSFNVQQNENALFSVFSYMSNTELEII